MAAVPPRVGVRPLVDFEAALALDIAVGTRPARPKTSVPRLLTRKDYSHVPVPTLPGLPFHIEQYMTSKPSKHERQQQNIDGHAIEYAIVCRLVNAGCSDDEIAAYFDSHQLPRHSEELAKPRGYGWLEQCIRSARAGIPPMGLNSPRTASGTGDTHSPLYVEKGQYPTPLNSDTKARTWVRIDHTDASGG